MRAKSAMSNAPAYGWIIVAVAAAVGLVALPLYVSWWWFQSSRTLVDGVAPALTVGLLLCGMLILGMSQAVRRRRSLEQEMQRQREEGARIAGELEAARRIQAGSLRRPEALAGDPRMDLHARLTPAREVGGACLSTKWRCRQRH